METLYFPEWSVVIAVRVSRSFSLFVPSIAGSCRVHACIEIGRVYSENLLVHGWAFLLRCLGTTTGSKDFFDERESCKQNVEKNDNTRLNPKYCTFHCYWTIKWLNCIYSMSKNKKNKNTKIANSNLFTNVFVKDRSRRHVAIVHHSNNRKD